MHNIVPELCWIKLRPDYYEMGPRSQLNPDWVTHSNTRLL